MANIDEFSVIPLNIETFYQTRQLGVATGFTVRQGKNDFLITNWHVVTGVNPYTNQPMLSCGLTPNKVRVWFNGLTLGSWIKKELPLFDETGKRLWLEHYQGNKIDVVAIPLSNMPDTTQYPVDLNLAKFDLMIYPSDTISIIGFPEGLTSGGMFPIWKTGHIASEPDFDYNNLPSFLIDATTKSGMSGSPVIAKRISIYQTSKGNQIGNAVRFLGIYAGREIGDGGIEVAYVWKPRAIEEVINGKP